jgi:hypothetical protein
MRIKYDKHTVMSMRISHYVDDMAKVLVHGIDMLTVNDEVGGLPLFTHLMWGSTMSLSLTFILL